MAYFQKQDSGSDWCHFCGARQGHNVEIWFSSDAEHRDVSTKLAGVCQGNGFLRICADCGEAIARIGRGELAQETRNNPALRKRRKTAHS
jgi:hypothetical protein